MTLTAPTPATAVAVWASAATAADLQAAYAAALTALRGVSTMVADYRTVDDATLMALNLSAAEQVTLAHTHQAVIAGEVARRSAPELGSQGLAQRTGHRTAEQFVKNTTGASGREAVTAVRAGVLMAETADAGSVDRFTGEILEPTKPWLVPVAEALTAGVLSTVAAEAIGSGLQHPNSAVTAEQLQQAAVALVGQAVAGLNVDALFK
jgi:hypothetical protein